MNKSFLIDSQQKFISSHIGSSYVFFNKKIINNISCIKFWRLLLLPLVWSLAWKEWNTSSRFTRERLMITDRRNDFRPNFNMSLNHSKCLRLFNSFNQKDQEFCYLWQNEEWGCGEETAWTVLSKCYRYLSWDFQWECVDLDRTINIWWW